MSGPRRPSEAPPVPQAWGEPTRATPPAHDSTTDVVRWAAFSCVLVPVVLLWYGTSLAGAAGTALGLAAVTAVCRILLRQSERGAARLLAEDRAPHRGRRHRTGTGTHRGGRHSGGNTPVG
ncbi:hypothetical protein [Streptomyces lincolnensis]|uniref:hypothetical protein n=1 Tax=Streptomyces lincolnensis TaxID=1915 RepID=UPI001E353231|nr:hypothetical protein [Streptomyces lincolnensis]